MVLVLVTFFWGTTFVIVKDAIETVPVHWFHTLRFGLGCFFVWGLALFDRERPKQPAPQTRLSSIATAGCLMGLALFLSYAFQTFGLRTTTASKSAFITGISVLFVPLLILLLPNRTVERRAIVSACIGFAGLFFLVLEGGLATLWEGGFVIGDGLTVFCAICVAIHLLLTKRYSHRHATAPLTAIQLTVVALLSLAASFLWGEQRPWSLDPSLYVAILFLALFPTAFNFWAMTRMQRHTTEQRVAVIFLFEPIFATATAWVVRGETLASIQWFGAGLILLAVVVLETSLFRRPAPH